MMFRKRKRKKRKENVNLLLLAACAGAVFYALNQHSAYVKANTENQQVKAAQDVLKQQIAEKDATIEALNKQIDDFNKSGASGEGDMVYEVIDGGMYFRTEPTTGSDTTTYNGNSQAFTGEKYRVIEVVDDLVSTEEKKWAKIDNDVYFCVESYGEIWAKKVN